MARGLDIVAQWGRLNSGLIDLIDAIPDDRMDWSPRPDLWTFRHLFQHLAEAREQWMVRAIDDGAPDIDVYKNVHSKADIRGALATTWARIEKVFTDGARLEATYRDRWWKEAPPYNGHWVAFHLLEHDIHHRADMLLYLSLLDIRTPQVWTP